MLHICLQELSLEICLLNIDVCVIILCHQCNNIMLNNYILNTGEPDS